MKIFVSPTPEALGHAAATEAAAIIRDAIARDGVARVVLSTGQSQFTMFESLVAQPDIDWQRVEMFHLDEYVGLPINHKASFRKYLKQRFIDKTHVGTVHFVDGTQDSIQALSREINRAPVCLGMIGIGQNAHIAFNDPPADFDTDEAFLFVTLDEKCIRQQVHEGWFATVDEVPKQAVTMSVRQIMKCAHIISAVPYPEKADAVAKTLESPVTNLIPATILKEHPNFSLHADADSFSRVDPGKILAVAPVLEYELHK